MREVLARSWVGVCLPLALSLSIYMIPLFTFGIVRSLSAKYRPDRYRRDKSVKFGTELP